MFSELIEPISERKNLKPICYFPTYKASRFMGLVT